MISVSLLNVIVYFEDPIILFLTVDSSNKTLCNLVIQEFSPRIDIHLGKVGRSELLNTRARVEYAYISICATTI